MIMLGDKKIYHPNGYSARLYGETSLIVYHNGKEVLHTGSRNVNTDTEVMELLETMPEFLQKIMGWSDEE